MPIMPACCDPVSGIMTLSAPYHEMSADLLQGLNPAQHAAVTAQGSALVLAGAGSGKTRVLTTRIAWLIQTAQASPMGLLAVTFTNKAAKEMLTRLSAMLPINTRGMWVGTFHGLCNRLLRTHHREAGLPQLFQILDSQDQLSVIKRTLLKSLNVDTDKYDPRKLQAFINMNKEAGLRADKVEAWDPYTRRLAEYFGEYDAQCQREGVVDFAELLLRSHELLARNALLREHYQERFKHILVDEFQDTSRLQYAWLQLLRGPGGALFAVGDDDQSIYAFRGADVGNMGQLMTDLGIAAPIKLTQNYRSHSTILDAANAVIGNNRNRLGKELWTDAGKGEVIRHFQASDDGEEARFVVEEIQAPASAMAWSTARWPCSTVPTPSRAPSSTPCSAPDCPTRSTAACAFSSAPRSSMPWPTCAWSPTRTTTTPYCASSISRRAASARAVWSN
jgi:DNA helicase-2/ATP-dependent DNA helicase PcrA